MESCRGLESNALANGESVQLLVHNISHADLVLSVNNIQRTLSVDQAIARPKFSCFRKISEDLYRNVTSSNVQSPRTQSEDQKSLSIRTHPGYQVSDIETAIYPRYKRVHNGLNGGSLQPVQDSKVPVGFRINARPLLLQDVSMLRFRRDDKNLVSNEKAPIVEAADPTCTECYIEAIYFPLLAILLPQWIEFTKFKEKVRFVIILISGRGSPQDQDESAIDNSTKFTGQLMSLFIAREYPEIEIIHLHSTANLFRYDDNVMFVNQNLKPLVDSYRNDLAQMYASKWKENFHVAMAFADGSSARISAVQAALRQYRPQYFHYWQMKTFWGECKICFDDIEYHTYEVIAAQPAMRVEMASKDVQLVVREMTSFIQDFQEILTHSNDLSSFWLRKSGKPVLAVLLVQKPGELPKIYRGTNVEVSMPTGSLCAERNAIGTALASDLSLKREHLKAVAVYGAGSVDLNDKKRKFTSHAQGQSSKKYGHDANIDDTTTSLSECDTRNTKGLIADSQSSVAELLANVDRKDTSLQIVDSMSPRSESALSSPNSPPGHGLRRKILSFKIDSTKNSKAVQNNDPDISTLKSFQSFSIFDQMDVESPDILSRSQLGFPVEDKPSVIGHMDSPRAHEKSLFNEDDGDNSTNYTDIIHVEGSDINPLKPCGACQEWLKKIAESNPQFCVVTFTDRSCAGVYVEEIAE